jgi:hypothetical protein
MNGGQKGKFPILSPLPYYQSPEKCPYRFSNEQTNNQFYEAIFPGL